jgi:hypothetical protein
MRRTLLALALVTAMALAVVAAPGMSGAAPRLQRFAPAKGIMTLSKLHLSGSQARAAAPLVSWTSAGTMQNAVQEIGGGAFFNGRGYVPGGFLTETPPTLLDKMQIYNSQANTWVTDPQPMPFGPWGDAAVCTDNTGKVHVVNGVDGSFLYAAHQVYDPAQPAGSRWTTLPYPLLADGITTYFSQSSGCVVIGNVLFLYGGYAAIGDPNDPTLTANPTKATWAFNLTSGVWTDTGKLMKTARMWFAYGRAGQNVGLAVGGLNNLTTFASLASGEKFSPTAGWTNIAPMPEGRIAPGLGVLQNNVMVFGGATGNAQGLTLLGSTNRCALATGCGAWSNANRDLVAPRWFHAFFSGGGKIFAAGGADTTGASLASAEHTP